MWNIIDWKPFFWMLLAIVSVQVPNYLGMNHALDNSGISVSEAFKIAFYTAPFTIIATAGFCIYYATGTSFYAYPLMVIVANATSVLAAIFVQFMLGNKQSVGTFESLGMLFSLLGLCFFIAASAYD